MGAILWNGIVMRQLYMLMAVVIGGSLPQVASAGATVDLLFVGRNGSPITPTNNVGGFFPPSEVVVSDTVTMAVVMTNDQALTAAVFSLNYDLDSRDMLNVVATFQWAGVAITATNRVRFEPLAPLAPTTNTFVGSFQGVSGRFDPPAVLPKAGGAFAGGWG